MYTFNENIGYSESQGLIQNYQNINAASLGEGNYICAILFLYALEILGRENQPHLLEIPVLPQPLNKSLPRAIYIHVQGVPPSLQNFVAISQKKILTRADLKNRNNVKNGYSVQGLVTKVKDTVAIG